MTQNKADNNNNSNNNKRDDEHEIFTPIARNLIQIVEDGDVLREEACKIVDKSIKLGSKIIVNEYESPIYKNALEDAKNQINKLPSPVTVGLATIIPYIIAKPKFLQLRPFNFAIAGFATSMYYCCPQVVSMASKKAVEVYNDLRQNL